MTFNSNEQFLTQHKTIHDQQKKGKGEGHRALNFLANNVIEGRDK